MTQARTKDAIAEDHKIERQGKQMVLYAGLLDAAHKKGLNGIETWLIQVPDYENGNVAIVRAVVSMEDSPADRPRKFSGIGDASPDNVGRNIAPHIIRMAETRAKARALRDAVNLEGAVDASDYAEEPDPAPVASIGAQHPMASDAQLDTLRTLAVQLAGENGVERLETRIGFPLQNLTRRGADEWIDKLTPEGR